MSLKSTKSLLYEVLAADHLAAYHFWSRFFARFSGEEGVSDDLGHGKPLEGLQGEHLTDEVLELRSEEALVLALQVVLEEGALLVQGNQSVKWILEVGSFEGSIARVHHEEDDAEGKGVHHLGLVLPPQELLGGHVAHRAHEAI